MKVSLKLTPSYTKLENNKHADLWAILTSARFGRMYSGKILASDLGTLDTRVRH